jgi:PAS domain-containing protein
MITPAAWSATEDILPLVGFIAALIAILMIPVQRGGSFTVAAKAFLASSVMCYLISTSASIMGNLEMFPAELEPVVTSIELLWVPLLLFGVYSIYANQQLNDSIAARHEVVRSSQMMERLMDTTPAGVIVLDHEGTVTFANPEARRLLDMQAAPGAESADPRWTILTGDDLEAASHQRADFGELVGPEPLLDMPVSVTWPNGWRRRLIVNTTPITEDDASVTGAVVAFVEREPWSPAARAASTTGLP